MRLIIEEWQTTFELHSTTSPLRRHAIMTLFSMSKTDVGTIEVHSNEINMPKQMHIIILGLHFARRHL